MNADKFEKYSLIFLSSIFLIFLIIFLTGCTDSAKDFAKDFEIATEKILDSSEIMEKSHEGNSSNIEVKNTTKIIIGANHHRI